VLLGRALLLRRLLLRVWVARGVGRGDALGYRTLVRVTQLIAVVFAPLTTFSALTSALVGVVVVVVLFPSLRSRIGASMSSTGTSLHACRVGSEVENLVRIRIWHVVVT
jgi:hypothetical protein